MIEEYLTSVGGFIKEDRFYIDNRTGTILIVEKDKNNRLFYSTSQVKNFHFSDLQARCSIPIYDPESHLKKLKKEISWMEKILKKQKKKLKIINPLNIQR